MTEDMRFRLIRPVLGPIGVGFFLLCLACAGTTDSDKTTPETAFFGEELPGHAPIQFAPEVLTADKKPHGSLSFAPDGSEILWSAFLDDGPEETIYSSTFDGVSLGSPQTVPFAEEFEFNHGPVFSSDGQRIFFTSRRPVPGLTEDTISAIWYVDRENEGWSEPHPVGVTADAGMFIGQVSVSRTGNLYYTARPEGEPFPKVRCCRLAGGEYTAPELLVGPIDVGADMVDPFVDPDERFLLFGSEVRPGGFGITDLYISYRNEDGTWGEATNLGGRVNTEHFERFPSLSNDGKYLFFVRSVGGPFGSGESHFYWLKADSVITTEP